MKTLTLSLALVISLLAHGFVLADTPTPTGECTHFNANGTCANYYTVVTEDTPGWQSNVITEDGGLWDCARMGNRVCGLAMRYVGIATIE